MPKSSSSDRIPRGFGEDSGDPLDGFVEHVCTELLEPLEVEPSSLGRSVFARKLKDAILRPTLDEEERQWVDSLPESGDGRGMDQLLTLRIQRALDRACKASGLDQNELARQLKESIVVARGDGLKTADSGTGSAISFSQTILQDSFELTVEAPHVLTNRGGELEFEHTQGLDSGGDLASHSIFEMTEALEAVEAQVLNGAPEEAQAKLKALARGGDLIGKTLNGKYLITGKLGDGGFGTVYQATDLGFAEELGEASGARVAIKVLNSKLQKSKKAIKSFLQEANRLTLLSHPNIVQWVTFDKTAEGMHYFVMEFLEGRELAQILREEKQLDPKRVGKILMDVLAALQCAHEIPEGRALLHLDLKPQNIFILGAAERGAETAKVIDFGIGQNVSNELAEIGQSFIDEDARNEELLERTIYPVAREVGAPDASAERDVRRAKGGTVLYSSPEQCKHLRKDHDIENLDERSDIYSLGVVGFRALTGTYPFARKATSLKEAYRQHLMEAPRKVRDVRPSVPRRMAAVIDRCLEKDKGARFQSAPEARAALEKAMQPLVSRSFMIGIPVMALPLIALALYTFFRPPEYRQITGVNVARSVRATALGEVGGQAREDVSDLTLFNRDKAIRVANDNSGRRTYLQLAESDATLGAPVLYRGKGAGDANATPMEEIVLESDGARYYFHAAEPEEIFPTDVFVRWPGAHRDSVAFRIASTPPLTPSEVRFQLVRDGDEKELGAATERASEEPAPLIWSEATASLQAKVFVDPRRVSAVGFRVEELGGTVHWYEPNEITSGVAASMDVSRLRGPEEGASTRTVQLLLEDGTGREVPMGEPLGLELAHRACAIDPGSLELVRLGSDPALGGALFPLPEVSGADRTVLLSPDVDRLSLRGRLLETPGGRDVLIRMTGLGDEQSIETSGGAFQFDVALRDIGPVPAGLTPAKALALAPGNHRLILEVVDAGVLPKGNLKGEPWSASLGFEVQDARLEAVARPAGGHPQNLVPGGTIYVRPGSVELGFVSPDPLTVLALFGPLTGDDSTFQLIDVVDGKRAAEEGTLSFEAHSDRSFVLRQFERVPLGLGELPSTDSSSSDIKAKLLAADLPPLAQVPFDVRVSQGISGLECGFADPSPMRLETPEVTAEMLQSLWVRLDRPASLHRIQVALLRNGRENSTASLRIAQLEAPSPGDPWRILPEQWAGEALGRPAWEDGEYTVNVTLEDMAGLAEEVPGAASFVVSARKPKLLGELHVATPQMTTVSVTCRLFDENGIQWPPAADLLVDGEEPLPMRLVTEEPLDEVITDAAVRFELDLLPAWSRRGASVEVRVAERGQPLELLESAELTLGRVRTSAPARLGPDETLKGSPMVLVRGPSGAGGYVFGEGRGNIGGELWKAFQATGVPYLKDARSYRSFVQNEATFFDPLKPIVIPSDDLADYYLDETEVTQSQFLEFVEDEEGYGDIRNWPFLSRMREADAQKILQRRAGWREDLGRKPDRDVIPVTGVLWEEAMAYARWAGKRLPTLLEWEYAVRGEEGRIFATESSTRSDGARAFLTENGELAPVQHPDYVSPDGLYHLCGNVAEWTQTAYWRSLPSVPFESGSLDFCARHVNDGTSVDDLYERFDRTPGGVYGIEGPLFFVVGCGWLPDGGKWKDSQSGLVMRPHDYRVVDRFQLDTTWKSVASFPRVGFRCAKSLP